MCYTVLLHRTETQEDFHDPVSTGDQSSRFSRFRKNLETWKIIIDIGKNVPVSAHLLSHQVLCLHESCYEPAM